MFTRGHTKLATQRNKKECFKQFGAGADIDPWESVYSVVMGRFKSQAGPQIICSDLLLKMFQSLFPQ